MSDFYEKATPRPWELDGSSGYGELNGYRVRASADPEFILAVTIGDVDALDPEANAALIVHAVNNIERIEALNAELLSALSALVERMERTGRETANTLDLALTKKARAALSKSATLNADASLGETDRG